MLFTSANAPTSRKYDASGDMVSLVPFLGEGGDFCIYKCSYIIVSSGVQGVVIGLCGCLFVCFFFFMVGKGEVR